MLKAFPDEKACLEYIFYHRHAFAPRCRKCGERASFKLTTYRRSFISDCCSAFSSPTAGTILDHTRLPLRMWFYALLLYSDLSTGVSQNSLRRLLGIRNCHAWALADKIRTHIALCESSLPLGGAGEKVYVDEAQVWIGAKQQRCILLGITDGKRCAIRIVRDRSAIALIPPIVEAVAPGSIIVSDGWPSYNHLEELGFGHSRVVHLRKMWVNEAGDSTTYVEGLWAILRRLLNGKAAQVTDENLWKFTAEVVHRYAGSLDPAEAWWKLIGSFRTIGPEDVSAARLRIDRRREG